MLFASEYGTSLVKSIVAYQKAAHGGGLFNGFCKQFSSLRYRFWSTVTASDIHRDAKISADLKLPHPTGVIIHRDTQVGSSCMIMQQVTLGQLAMNGAPIVGNGVYIGAGAKVLGAIRIGDNARIGANAVVLEDVPANCTAVGVPARIISRSVQT